MIKSIGEWLLAVAILFILIVLFAFGGVLISAFALVLFGTLGLFIVADVLLAPFRWFSSLFRRSEATTERERRDGG